jgi:hypothetical protein
MRFEGKRAESEAKAAERRRLILRLIKLNRPRRQLFDGIWWSGDSLRIKRQAYGEIELFGWDEVTEMVEKAEAELLKQSKTQRSPRLPRDRVAKSRTTQKNVRKHKH